MKMLRSKFAPASLLGALCLCTLGCNVGNAPPPMSDADAIKSFNNLSPADQIKDVQMAAMTPEQKAKAIADIEAKTGYKPASTAPLPGPAGGANTIPGSGGVPMNGGR